MAETSVRVANRNRMATDGIDDVDAPEDCVVMIMGGEEEEEAVAAAVVVAAAACFMAYSPAVAKADADVRIRAANMMNREGRFMVGGVVVVVGRKNRQGFGGVVEVEVVIGGGGFTVSLHVLRRHHLRSALAAAVEIRVVGDEAETFMQWCTKRRQRSRKRDQ